MAIGTWHGNKWWSEYATEILPTGSRYICDPPVMGTDEDFLLLIEESSFKPFVEHLKKEGFKVGGSSADGKMRYTPPVGTEEYDVPGNSTNGWEAVVPWVYQKDNPKLIKYVYVGKNRDPEPLKEFPDFENKKGVFCSFKKDGLNLIVTASPEYFENFTKATKMATYLNLLDKRDRVALFQAVCFDDWNPEPRYRRKKKKSSEWWAQDAEQQGAIAQPIPVPAEPAGNFEMEIN